MKILNILTEVLYLAVSTKKGTNQNATECRIREARLPGDTKCRPIDAQAVGKHSEENMARQSRPETITQLRQIQTEATGTAAAAGSHLEKSRLFHTPRGGNLEVNTELTACLPKTNLN